MIVAKLVAATAGESNDDAVMIRSRERIVDRIFFRIRGSSVGLVGIREDEIAVFYSANGMLKMFNYLLFFNSTKEIA